MRRNRQGFTLIEVLIVLSLTGVFATLAYRLLVANLRLTANVAEESQNSARFDDAVRMLRADVANAASVEMPAVGVLRLRLAGKPDVEWRSNHDALSRKAGTSDRHWEVGRPLNLKLEGAVVLLAADSAQPIAMASMHLPGGTP